MLYNVREVMNMTGTVYLIGLFVLAIVLYVEQFFHLDWQFKPGIKAVIFILYLILGIYFNLI